jgi:hypothetical protein
MNRKNMDGRHDDRTTARPFSEPMFDDDLVTPPLRRRPSSNTMPWISPTATVEDAPAHFPTEAPGSSRAPSQWFASSSLRESIGHELDEPPRPHASKGIAFAIVSMLLVGGVTAGVIVFAGRTAHAPTTSRVVEPVSTTRVTNAEAPAASSPEPTSSGGAESAQPPPSSFDVSPRASSAPPIASAESEAHRSPPKVGRKRNPPAQTAPERRAKPASTTSRGSLHDDRALPDLDRAYKAASPDRDVFATSSASPDAPTSPAPTSTSIASDPSRSQDVGSAPTAAPSEVLPELKLHP